MRFSHAYKIYVVAHWCRSIGSHGRVYFIRLHLKFDEPHTLFIARCKEHRYSSQDRHRRNRMRIKNPFRLFQQSRTFIWLLTIWYFHIKISNILKYLKNIPLSKHVCIFIRDFLCTAKQWQNIICTMSWQEYFT